jgi:SnoaL-like protein
MLIAAVAIATTPVLAAPPNNKGTQSMTLTRTLYDSFQKVEIDLWDAIIADDVLTNSPGGANIKGRAPLKAWATAFAGTLAYQIDLVDEHLALDGAGDGRAFITFNLHWKHNQDFMGLAPTGREGTSVETLLLTVRANKIVRVDVADNSLDLALYLWDRGWPHPHNWNPPAIVTGVNRREPT